MWFLWLDCMIGIAAKCWFLLAQSSLKHRPLACLLSAGRPAVSTWQEKWEVAPFTIAGRTPTPTPLSLSQAHTHAHQYTKAFNCLWLEMQKHIWKTLGDVGYHRVSSVRKCSLTVKARLVSTSCVCVCVCVSRRGIRAWCRSVALTQQSIDAQRTN